MPVSRIDSEPATKPELTILLAAPRGFCAGVDRAIQIVELALAKYGPPVYVRHEIVHNRFVVDSLRAKGAIFVEDLNEIPETGAPVIFSAHGVPKSVPAAAEARNLFHIDATCPLVSKVHKESHVHFNRGLEIVLIGQAFQPRDASRLAYVTQTTLSVDDTAEIVAVLHARFPNIDGPVKEDICYATTNRQTAVKAIAPRIERLIVVGAPNSSNSMRLVEVAEKSGCPQARLVQTAADIRWSDFDGVRTIGITAGASAPEVLVNEVVDAFRARFEVRLEVVTTAQERIAFNVPRELRPAAAT